MREIKFIGVNFLIPNNSVLNSSTQWLAIERHTQVVWLGSITLNSSPTWKMFPVHLLKRKYLSLVCRGTFGHILWDNITFDFRINGFNVLNYLLNANAVFEKKISEGNSIQFGEWLYLLITSEWMTTSIITNSDILLQRVSLSQATTAQSHLHKPFTDKKKSDLG